METLAVPYVMVDIESDGPIPGDYSMVGFGAVIVELGRIPTRWVAFVRTAQIRFAWMAD